MTNPNDAVGTNAAYGTRTSVNAFNDIAQLVNGRGVLSGWSVVPKTGMTVEVGGIAGTRDVAIAEDNLGNRTTINNKSNNPIEITIGAASASSNRYDAIVVYVNNPAQAEDETPDAPSVCGVIAVQGGATGVSEQQIRAAISADGGTGSVAYYAVLATIYIAANTTSITAGNITMSASSADKIDWSGILETKTISGTTDNTGNLATGINVDDYYIIGVYEPIATDGGGTNATFWVYDWKTNVDYQYYVHGVITYNQQILSNRAVNLVALVIKRSVIGM